MASTMMRRPSWQYLGLVVAAGLLSFRPACGDISFAPVTWGNGGSTLGWAQQSGNATSVDSPSTGGSGDNRGYLAINFDPADPMTFQSTAVANAGPGYNGDYRSSGLGLTFDLRGYASSYHQLYFVSAAAGGSTWWWDLQAPAADQVWQSYTVNFHQEGPGAWYTAGSADFLTALSQVDSIGLILSHYGTDASMQYGLDNWQFNLPVPEPGVAAMGAVLALTTLFWVRRIMRARRV
jgi:hypothetical protein